MANYAILRFSKRKAGGVASADRHNERKKQSYQSNPDIDIERSKLNYHFVKPQGTYKAAYTKMTETAGCKIRKNSTVMVETLLTATREFLQTMNEQEQNLFFRRVFDFMAGKIGKQNIISAVVHMDETTPHMHLSFCPITTDNRLSAKDILGNRVCLEKWQDDYHAAMSAHYPELSRGLSSRITKRKHIPVYLYKQTERLDNAHDEIQTAIRNIGTFNAGKKRDEALAVLEKHLPDMTKFTAQIKRTDDYIKELKDGKTHWEQTLDRRNDNLQADNERMTSEIYKLQHEAFQMREQQRRYERILAKLPPELQQIKPKSRGER